MPPLLLRPVENWKSLFIFFYLNVYIYWLSESSRGQAYLHIYMSGNFTSLCLNKKVYKVDKISEIGLSLYFPNI